MESNLIIKNEVIIKKEKVKEAVQIGIVHILRGKEIEKKKLNNNDN